MSVMTKLVKPVVEGLPFERREDDTQHGWALFLEWLEAPPDKTLAQWAAMQPDSLRVLVESEGVSNDWTRRRIAYYRHAAEMASCLAAARSSRAMLKVLDKWLEILDNLTDDLDLTSKNVTDITIERLRVTTDAIEKIQRVSTGNKFMNAIFIANHFGKRESGDGRMKLSDDWYPAEGATVIENEDSGE